MDSPFKSPGKLPSLPALRAFEAAARHGHFGRAADELFVTHGAISHQIRALEDTLGFALFTRDGRGVKLTAEGRRLAATLNASLCDIGGTIAELQHERARPRVVLTCLPSFAAKWLTPRLGSFIDRHPEIEIWIRSTKAREDLAAEGIDLGLRVGPGDWPGVHCEPLMRDAFVVVASPDIPGGLPATPADLARWPLLRSSTEPWHDWFVAAGLDWPEPQQGLVFSDSGLLVQSVLDRQGIGLAREVLVHDDLAAGRLVRVFPFSVPMAGAYWLIAPAPPPYRPAVATFVDWLRNEAARSGYAYGESPA
ncbi:transcriptional regulator GcvA [Jeongeupia chitinilytica]|uniref:DNA-binding transcriptional activator GcvA n=1 Tax=Jeongeupia chitinilytica TaxID=1041641 RepID=A0ABQ3H5K8_9NEIS|nr:transcriptional regulator GcvA [Jeongeupia chitinilytica]GHD69243.1 DNA-binding transcriptional activator GcvA [Jeongeupia chitinilytica]